MTSDKGQAWEGFLILEGIIKTKIFHSHKQPLEKEVSNYRLLQGQPRGNIPWSKNLNNWKKNSKKLIAKIMVLLVSTEKYKKSSVTKTQEWFLTMRKEEINICLADLHIKGA
jgi:hypothetical protein